MNGAYRSHEKPAFTDKPGPLLYLFMLSFMSCAALLSSGNICGGLRLTDWLTAGDPYPRH